MFDCGCSYFTVSGRKVRIDEARDVGGPQHIVYGDDGFWRSALPEDSGRVLGADIGEAHPLNLVPPSKPLD